MMSSSRNYNERKKIVLKKMLVCCVFALTIVFALSGCSSDPFVAQETAQALSWRQCPEPVRRYLDCVAANPYSEDDVTNTFILDYAPFEADPANTKPVKKTINGVVYTDNVPGEPIPIMVGGLTGTLTASDPLRWINTKSAPPSGNAYSRGCNCRDLGGWPCDGGAIRYGMLIRSGELNPADRELMVDTVGIRTEINLLPQDKQGRADSVWGIDYIANPTNENLAYRMDDVVRDQWERYLRAAMESVLNGKPVIFHCGAGDDNTGTFAVMLMGLLGCDHSSIDQDYELTNFAFYSRWRNRTYPGYHAYLDAIRAVPLAFALEDTFQNHCVSFALSLGIPLDEINAFRAACIDGEPEVIAAGDSAGAKNLLETVGCLDGKRIAFDADSDNKLVDQTAFSCTGAIPVRPGDVIRISGLTIDDSGVVAAYDEAQKFLFGAADFSPNQSYSGPFGSITIDADGHLIWTYDASADESVAYVRVSGPRAEGSVLFATKNEPLPTS